MTPLFSILIPSIPSRTESMRHLYDKIDKQIGDSDEVEICVFIDNKKRSIGLKRDALVQIARGDYLAFVDDDDDVTDDYIRSILKAIKESDDPDIIVFDQLAHINGENEFRVRFGIEFENQEIFKEDGKWQPITRKPFHVCAWKRSIAQSERFSDASYGEDWHWCDRLLPKVKNQVRINKILHKYKFDREITEAEATFPE